MSRLGSEKTEALAKTPTRKGQIQATLRKLKDWKIPGCGRMHEESEGTCVMWVMVPFTSIRLKERGAGLEPVPPTGLQRSHSLEKV